MVVYFCRRFGRAGASVLQDGSTSLIAGVDEEEEEEAEGRVRGGGVDGKSSSQTRRPSQSGERKPVGVVVSSSLSSIEPPSS